MRPRIRKLLDERHWQEEGFKETMPIGNWQEVLEIFADRINFKGITRQLKAKLLRPGLVVVFKEPEEING